MAGAVLAFGTVACGGDDGGGGGQTNDIEAPKLDVDPAYVIVPATRDVVISWKANFNATDYEVKLAGGEAYRTGGKNSYTFKAADLGYEKEWDFGVRTIVGDRASEWSQGTLKSAAESMVGYFAGTWATEPTKLDMSATVQTPNYPTLFGEVRTIDMTQLFDSELFNGGNIPAVGDVEFTFVRDEKVGNRLYMTTDGSSLIQWLPEDASAFLEQAQLDVELNNRVEGNYGKQSPVEIDLKSEANGYTGVSLSDVPMLGDLLGGLANSDFTSIIGDSGMLGSIAAIFGAMDQEALLSSRVEMFTVTIDDTSFKGEMTDAAKTLADMTVALEGHIKVTFNAGSAFSTGFGLLYPNGMPVTFSVVAPCKKVR